jgi:hypothetical protein
VARAPDPAINDVFVRHIELFDEKETKTDFSAPANMRTYYWWTDVQIKKEDFDEYVRVLMTTKDDWEETPVATEDNEDTKEDPPGTCFGF